MVISGKKKWLLRISMRYKSPFELSGTDWCLLAISGEISFNWEYWKDTGCDLGKKGIFWEFLASVNWWYMKIAEMSPLEITKGRYQGKKPAYLVTLTKSPLIPPCIGLVWQKYKVQHIAKIPVHLPQKRVTFAIYICVFNKMS